ncbi:MAG TPA: hydrogenase maturation nickel metallochaperone HypA [Anaerolineales bacterium]|nr:hydrogenase maturation nickel metallochaperone HypA [Anaerolineales bacterium]
MRELSLTQNLLDTALKQADSRRIVNVNLLIGPFSEEREESIRFYWRDLAKGTPGEGATLHFQHIATDMKCVACGGAFDPESGQSICAYCQSDRLQLMTEKEVTLESVDME